MNECRCLVLCVALGGFAPTAAFAQGSAPPAPPPPAPIEPSTLPPASTEPSTLPPPASEPAAPAPPAAVSAAPTTPAPAAPAVSPELAAATASGLNYERDTTWDLNLEGGYGRFFSDPAKNTGFVRARGGVLFIRNSTYRALGITYEYSALSPAAFGVQGEVLNLELGLWTQLGGFVDVSGHFGAQLAAGWSLFGVEGQYRAVQDRGSGFAVFGKLRLPISIIARALK